MRSAATVCVVGALVLLAGTASASGIPFDITYVGTWSDDAKTALQSAADIWGSLLIPSHAGETIAIEAKFEDLPDTALAGTTPASYETWAGSFFVHPTALANHRQQIDYTPGAPDILMTFDTTTSINTPRDWYFGTDGNLGAGQYDFMSLALHEITHGLGWLSAYLEDGGFAFSKTNDQGFSFGTGFLYDAYISHGASNPPVWLIEGGDDAAAKATRAAQLVSGDLWWRGWNGVAGNGDVLPEVYSPNPFKDGSSVAHLDPIAFDGYLMQPSLGANEWVHTVSAMELGMMHDIGWTQSVVPEPSTVILILGGGLVMGFSARRRRRR